MAKQRLREQLTLKISKRQTNLIVPVETINPTKEMPVASWEANIFVS